MKGKIHPQALLHIDMLRVVVSSPSWVWENEQRQEHLRGSHKCLAQFRTLDFCHRFEHFLSKELVEYQDKLPHHKRVWKDFYQSKFEVPGIDHWMKTGILGMKSIEEKSCKLLVLCDCLYLCYCLCLCYCPCLCYPWKDILVHTPFLWDTVVRTSFLL